MPDALPATLSGAARMLRSAYPGGMSDAAYLPLLALLYEHVPDHNLVELMAAVTGKDAAALNDVYACASSKPEAPAGAARLAGGLRGRVTPAAKCNAWDNIGLTQSNAVRTRPPP